MKTVFAEIEGALVVRRGSMTRIFPKSTPAWWLRGDGAVGVDVANGEAVRWSVPSRRGMRVIGTEPVTSEMEELEAAVATAGLAIAGVVDMRVPRRA